MDHYIQVAETGPNSAHPGQPVYCKLDAARQMALNWQTIESAPKDGVNILCYCERNTRVRIMHWHQPANPAAKGFWIGYHGSDQPTHWMPLPFAPVTLGQRAPNFSNL